MAEFYNDSWDAAGSYLNYLRLVKEAQHIVGQSALLKPLIPDLIKLQKALDQPMEADCVMFQVGTIRIIRSRHAGNLFRLLPLDRGCVYAASASSQVARLVNPSQHELDREYLFTPTDNSVDQPILGPKFFFSEEDLIRRNALAVGDVLIAVLVNQPFPFSQAIIIPSVPEAGSAIRYLHKQIYERCRTFAAEP